jgi:hypothetical protein
MIEAFPAEQKWVICPLEEICKYKNEDVIYSFLDRFDLTYDETDDLFKETYKWLWLCAKAQSQGFGALHINSDLRILDQAWHTFVLYTKEYHEFCRKHFSYFVHHKPTTYKEKVYHAEMVQHESFRLEKKLREEKFHEYVLDNLGKETLYKWFIEYPRRYSTEKINILSKKVYNI